MKMFIVFGLLIGFGMLTKMAVDQTGSSTYHTAGCIPGCNKPKVVLPNAVESEFIKFHKGYLHANTAPKFPQHIVIVPAANKVAAQAE